MRLLIVDDNKDTRRLIRRLMKDIAGEFAEANDGSEAVALYRELRPDWVVMDIEMSGMDGIAAMKSIRLADPGAKMIVVTMHNDERLREEARRAGASGYVLKENLMELPSVILRNHPPLDPEAINPH